METIMIEVKALSKKYGDRFAIKDIHFTVDRGELVGFLGPNGAGKTTTMKIITGFMAPSSGSVQVGGYDVFENPMEVKTQIGYLPETPPVYMDMRVKDYLKYVAELRHVEKSNLTQYIGEALEKTDLASVENRLIENLSKGFRQRVGIAQALVSKPDILILDEPTVGLDPNQVAQFRKLIKDLKGHHTIILSTHILSEVQASCEKVVIVNEGRIVAQDNIKNLSQKAKAHSQLKVRTLKPIENLESFLSDIEDVLSWDGVGSQWSLSLKPEVSDGEIAAISNALSSAGNGLLEFQVQKAQLEEIFLDLTKSKSNEVNS